MATGLHLSRFAFSWPLKHSCKGWNNNAVDSTNMLQLMDNLCMSATSEKRAKANAAVDKHCESAANRVVTPIHRQSKKPIKIF
jgi:hypothetical protein